MDMVLFIKERMETLGLEQKDLAAAAEVTESYISQLLTRRKAPPAPERTDIYAKLESFLKLPGGHLAKLAEAHRKEELKRKVVEPPAPLFREVREVILRKCVPAKAERVRAIFERQAFGELERLVTQKLLDVVKTLAKEELGNERWLHQFARHGGRSYREVRVGILEFLDTDVLQISNENCAYFLEPLVESWDIDLGTFGIEVILNRRLAAGQSRRFEFVEHAAGPGSKMEPGLVDYLEDATLSGDVTEREVEFLKRLRFNGARPTALYFYREVQSLRDPLHFRRSPANNRSPSPRASKRSRRKSSR